MRLTLRAAFRNSLKQRVVVSVDAQEASGTHISTSLVTWPLTTMMHRCSVDGKQFKGFTLTGNKKVSKKLELNLLSSVNTFLMFYFDHFWNTMKLKVVHFSAGTIYHSWSSWSVKSLFCFQMILVLNPEIQQETEIRRATSRRVVSHRSHEFFFYCLLCVFEDTPWNRPRGVRGHVVALVWSWTQVAFIAVMWRPQSSKKTFSFNSTQLHVTSSRSLHFLYY